MTSTTIYNFAIALRIQGQPPTALANRFQSYEAAADAAIGLQNATGAAYDVIEQDQAGTWHRV